MSSQVATFGKAERNDEQGVGEGLWVVKSEKWESCKGRTRLLRCEDSWNKADSSVEKGVGGGSYEANSGAYEANSGTDEAKSGSYNALSGFCTNKHLVLGKLRKGGRGASGPKP